MDYTGKKVMIVGNTTNHMWRKGQIVEIISNNYNYGCGCGCGDYDDDDEPYGNYSARDKSGAVQTIGPKDFILYKLNKEAIMGIIHDIQGSIDKKAAEIESWEDKIKYMEEVGTEFYIEEEWKAYKMLQTINEETSDFQKAQLIAKLLGN